MAEITNHQTRQVFQAPVFFFLVFFVCLFVFLRTGTFFFVWPEQISVNLKQGFDAKSQQIRNTTDQKYSDQPIWHRTSTWLHSALLYITFLHESGAWFELQQMVLNRVFNTQVLINTNNCYQIRKSFAVALIQTVLFVPLPTHAQLHTASLQRVLHTALPITTD